MATGNGGEGAQHGVSGLSDKSPMADPRRERIADDEDGSVTGGPRDDEAGSVAGGPRDESVPIDASGTARADGPAKKTNKKSKKKKSKKKSNSTSSSQDRSQKRVRRRSRSRSQSPRISPRIQRYPSCPLLLPPRPSRQRLMQRLLHRRHLSPRSVALSIMCRPHRRRVRRR